MEYVKFNFCDFSFSFIQMDSVFVCREICSYWGEM